MKLTRGLKKQEVQAKYSRERNSGDPTEAQIENHFPLSSGPVALPVLVWRVCTQVDLRERREAARIVSAVHVHPSLTLKCKSSDLRDLPSSFLFSVLPTNIC